MSKKLFAFVCLTTSMLAQAEGYTTKSIFSADYKCTAQETGGFNHAETGHKLVLFKPDEEFFLIHISNIPQKAVFEMKSKEIVALLGNDEDRVREEVERSYMKQEIYSEDFVSEKSSYFIRESDDNPEKVSTYLSNHSCSAAKFKKDFDINCYEGDGGKTFQFNSKTGRFAYSYAGSWHSESENNYYGDSSIFVFGSCKEYYR
ncbi:hypothetical protein [Marinobacter psychrophilus]|nr:hypothetical protein [Marinobacter psychrophilus]